MAKNIHIKHMLAFLQDNYTTVGVVFTNDFGTGQGKEYTYKVLLEDNIQVGDTCIVEVSGVLKTVMVVSVHETPKIEPTATYGYKWIVQKVNLARYKEKIEMESKVEDMFFEMERETQRKEFVEKFKSKLEGNEKAMALFDQAQALINPKKALTDGS